MAQANTDNSTPAPVDPTRRRFLSNAASLATAGTAIALAIPPAPAVAAARRDPLDPSKASPALRAAVQALAESNDRLEAAKERFKAHDEVVADTMADWEINNPKPTSKRGIKRWQRKWREHRHAAVEDTWEAQLAADEHFQAAQIAVANVTPRDEDDLALKAAAASIYDRVKAGYRTVAIISY